jgi:acyl-CoA thioester hydrolase
MPPAHLVSFRVYYEDTDAAGVVYHANYLRWGERARTEWLREMGISQSALMQEGIGFVVSDARLKLKALARLDDEIAVRTHVAEMKGARIAFEQEFLLKETGAALARLEAEVACVALPGFRPVRVPKLVSDAVRAYAAGE